MKWQITSVLFALLAVLFAVLALMNLCMYQNVYTRLRKAEVDLEIIVPLVKEHDDIMLTYKFFNEHWTAQMRGEK